MEFIVVVNQNQTYKYKNLTDAEKLALEFVADGNHCEIYVRIVSIENLIELEATSSGKKCQCNYEAGDSPCEIHDQYYALGLLEL